MPLRPALLVLFVASTWSASAAAQDRSSHYLHLDHWAYRYVDLLIERGRLTQLQPLVRPYRRLDIARAVGTADTAGVLDDVEREWVGLLRAEFAPEIERPSPAADSALTYLSGGVAAGAWGLSDRHRDVLRPEGDAAAFGFLHLLGATDFPGVTAALRFRYDGWLINDPQFPDGKVVEEHPNFLGFLDFAGRAEEGYAELQLPYFRLLAGRISRNWGQGRTDGLLVSDYSYSYDQISYRVGSDKLSITGFVTQLDEWDGSVKRWHSAHRLDWRVSDALSLGFGEAVTWGGENRSFDFRMVMPIALWFVGGYGRDWQEGPNRNNSFTDLSVWWKPSRRFLVYGSVMFDDFPGGGSPLAHGLEVGLHVPYLTPRLALRVDYSQVATLTYRTTLDYERYAFRDIGIGRDMSDYDFIAVELDWIPLASLFLTPSVQFLRRGEGDFRDPWPEGVTEDGPVLFIGELEKTLRLAIKGQWIWRHHLLVDWDVGENFVWTKGHVAGENASEFVARVRVSLMADVWGKM